MYTNISHKLFYTWLFSLVCRPNSTSRLSTQWLQSRPRPNPIVRLTNSINFNLKSWSHQISFKQYAILLGPMLLYWLFLLFLGFLLHSSLLVVYLFHVSFIASFLYAVTEKLNQLNNFIRFYTYKKFLRTMKKRLLKLSMNIISRSINSFFYNCMTIKLTLTLQYDPLLIQL